MDAWIKLTWLSMPANFLSSWGKCGRRGDCERGATDLETLLPSTLRPAPIDAARRTPIPGLFVARRCGAAVKGVFILGEARSLIPSVPIGAGRRLLRRDAMSAEGGGDMNLIVAPSCEVSDGLRLSPLSSGMVRRLLWLCLPTSSCDGKVACAGLELP